MNMFKDYPDYPFNEYYKSTNQYIFAQQYWLCILRKTNGFAESDWGAVIRPVDIERDLIDGLMFWIRKHDFTKEIIFHTNSFDGAINQYKKDNSGMSEEGVQRAKDVFDYSPPEAIVRGLTWDEAKKEVETYYEAFLASVEAASAFKNDSSHPERGYEVSTERLIITSEISETSEPKAIQALELFLQDGPAMERVNSIFVSNEDGS